MDKVTSRNFCKIYKDIQKNSVKNKKKIGAKEEYQYILHLFKQTRYYFSETSLERTNL